MKNKTVTSFVCQECGYDAPSWLGKCPECGMWNSLKEITVEREASNVKRTISKQDITPKTLSEITYQEKDRLPTGFSEMDGVFGGGIVRGSVTLIAGDPGIGKSTLLLQVALAIAKGTKGEKNPSNTVLYVSAEESAEQIKLRVTRISPNNEHKNMLILSATNVDAIVEVIASTKPQVVIIDSIQTMESENVLGLSGAIGQVRYATFLFVKLAKTLGIPILIVGHVTKEGMVAGPMMLSHMVDTVLFLEGEKFTSTRILRSLKNRFGPVDEVGIFTMEEVGMTQVKNPEHLFLTERDKKTFGTTLIATLEGTRAFLVEMQALVVSSKLPLPRRVASGIDAKRLELLLAVLQKHARLPIGMMDVFVNIAGGLKIADPAADLGICLSLFSSIKNVSLSKTVAIGEVGLLGELRPVPMLEKRVKEAKKLGFTSVLSAQTHKTLLDVLKSIV